MSKQIIAYRVGDISDLARALRRQLHDHADVPGQVEMLNLLARCAGFANFQSYRQATLARPQPAAAEEVPQSRLAAKFLALFDGDGRLLRWPVGRPLQQLVLWFLWGQFDYRRSYGEVEVNRLLNVWHAFGDPALLRRELVGQGLLARTADCRAYHRIRRQAPDEVIAIHKLRKIA